MTRPDHLVRSTRDLLNTFDAIAKRAKSPAGLGRYDDVHGRLLLTVLHILDDFESSSVVEHWLGDPPCRERQNDEVPS